MAGGISSDINPMQQHEPMAEERLAQLTADELTGSRAYTETGEWIGEISELKMNDEGTIEAAIVDVGGFLGIGEKPVELSFDQLDNMWDAEDGVASVSIPMTEEELDALPAYEG